MTELKPGKERAFRLLTILLIVLGFVSVRWGWSVFTVFVQKQKLNVALLSYLGILVLLALPGFPIGIYGFRVARRIASTGQVPSSLKGFLKSLNPEVKTLSRRTGQIVYFISFLLILCSIGVVTLCYKLYQDFNFKTPQYNLYTICNNSIRCTAINTD